MGRIRFTLSTLLFYVTMAFICLMTENVVSISTNGTAGFSSVTFLLMTATIILLALIYLFTEHRRNKMKIDFILLPVLIIFLVVGLIAIWSNKLQTVFTDVEKNTIITVNITRMEQIRYSIELCVVLLGIYLTWFVFGRMKIRARKLLWMALLVILAGFVLCAISLFKDRNVLSYFKATEIDIDAPGAKSVFNNENVFGLYLLICLFASFLVIYHKRKWWWMWFVVLFFLGFTALTTSATSILIALVGTAIFILLEIIFGFVHKKYVSSTIVAILYFAIGIGGIMFLALSESTFSNAILSFLNNAVFFKDLTTFTGRVVIWKAAFDMVGNDPFRMAFGYGYGISKILFKGFATTRFTSIQVNSTHNGFMQIYIMGGLIGLGSYLMLLVYYLYCCIRLLKRKKIHFTLVYGLCFTAFIAHSVFESTYMLQMSVMGLLVSILFYLPPIFAWRSIKHSKYTKSIETFYAIPTQGVPSHNFVPMVSNIIFSLLLPSAFTFGISGIYGSKALMTIITMIVVFLGISLIFVPYLSFLWYKRSTDRRLAIRVILNSMWILGITVGGTLFVHEFIWTSKLTYVVVGSILYTICLVLATVVYSIFREGSFKQWFMTTFKSIILQARVAKLVSIIVICVITILVQTFMKIDYLELLFLVLLEGVIFWMLYAIIPSKKKESIINDFNEEGILELKRLYMEDTV